MSWYLIEKINDTLYKISENKHWEKTNMYYLIGKERNLLIDTGTGIKPLKSVLLKIDDKPIDVVLTHAHWDHMGNIHEFEDVYVHPLDLKWVQQGLPIPESYIKEMMLKNVDEAYLTDFTYPALYHKNAKDISKYDIEGINIIHTPGHSPGSVCLYDNSNNILFSGDILYEGTIYCHYESTNPKDLFESIKHIKNLEIKRILSGHYNDPNIRIISDLYEIMVGFENEKLLHHGGGLRCKESICLQL